jgi:hypothetical protein
LIGVGCPSAIETLARISPRVSFTVRIHVHEARLEFLIFKNISFKSK